MTLEEAAQLRLDTAERQAMTIILSEFEGNRFDWHNMRWIKEK